jgi:hypothetical protein
LCEFKERRVDVLVVLVALRSNAFGLAALFLYEFLGGRLRPL